jgi:putative YjhG/YagF family dehydratase
MAQRSARALYRLDELGLAIRDILTPANIRNAMVLHAAFGGSTNLLLHIPAIAHAAGLKLPTVEDWIDINRRVPRLVSVLPNGPVHHPTVRVFLAGGVPEVMLHLRKLGLLETGARTVSGRTLGECLDWWETCERRRRFRELLFQQDGVQPDEVILPPEQAKLRGLTSTLAFPRGNLAPEGAVVKSTAIDPSVVDGDGVYRKSGPARVFVSEKDAIAAIKQGRIKEGDVMVLTGVGPMGTGMEETYQVTGALKHLPLGKHVALITDARFSGVSTGACIGHVGPEGLAGGPIGKVVEGDTIRIHIDLNQNEGSIDLVGEGERRFTAKEGAKILAARPLREDLAPHTSLPEDTRLWAALQAAAGGTWRGCVYDGESIIAVLNAGRAKLNKERGSRKRNR